MYISILQANLAIQAILGARPRIEFIGVWGPGS